MCRMYNIIVGTEKMFKKWFSVFGKATQSVTRGLGTKIESKYLFFSTCETLGKTVNIYKSHFPQLLNKGEYFYLILLLSF